MLNGVMARRRWLDEADVGLALVTIFIAMSLLLPCCLFVLHLGAAGCGETCDSTTTWWTPLTFFAFDGILFAAVMPLYLLRAKRWERTWWIPAGGILLLAVGALIAYLVIRIAIPTL